MNTVATKGAAKTSLLKSRERPVKLLRRLGLTEYHVDLYISNPSKETLEQKLLRLIEREVNGKACLIARRSTWVPAKSARLGGVGRKRVLLPESGVRNKTDNKEKLSV